LSPLPPTLTDADADELPAVAVGDTVAGAT
jgi:hypothetical protein